MNSRRARMRTNRRVLLVSLAVSLALHGWVLAALTLDPVDMSRSVGQPYRTTAPAAIEEPYIEVVRVVEPEEEVTPLPPPTEMLSIVADPSPERSTEPTAQNAEPASAEPVVDATASAEGDPAMTVADLMANGLRTPAGIAMPSQFVEQRSIEGWSPVTALDPHAGHDHEEEQVTNGSSWWRRVGKTFGFGGDRVCRVGTPLPRRVAGR